MRTTCSYFAGGQRVALRTNDQPPHYLVSDHLGSTSLTLDSAGTKIAELRYMSWGDIRYTSGSTPTQHRYTGQIQDNASGLYFYNARYYDPLLGRFAQADTIVPEPGNPLAWDRYAYTYNNPIKYNDPSGHSVGNPAEMWCGGVPGADVCEGGGGGGGGGGVVVVIGGIIVAGGAAVAAGLEMVEDALNDAMSPSSGSKNTGSIGSDQAQDDTEPPLPVDLERILERGPDDSVYGKTPEELLAEGWQDVTHPEQRRNSDAREYLDPVTGLRVRYDPGDPSASGWEARDHLHIHNPDTSDTRNRYLDQNGNPVPRGSKRSHIPYR